MMIIIVYPKKQHDERDSYYEICTGGQQLFLVLKKKVKSMRLINGLFQVCGVYIANVYIYI